MIEFALSDIFDLQQGFAFKSKDFLPEGVPILKIKNVKSSGLSLHQLDYVNEVFLDTHGKYIPDHGDALISMSGNRLNGSKETWVGKVALFKEEATFLVNQRVGILKNKIPQEANTGFLVYALSSDYWQLRFAQTATSSGGQANLSTSQILSESVFLPSLPDQKAIAHILGTLDDKIELNQKMNQTLEEIAKAIFKSWFVDFDPVRAKAEGRPTGLPPEISDLFPDELVDSEIGEIPKGWDLVPLGDHTELTKGRSYKSAELMDSDTALVTLKSFKRGGGYRLDGLKPYVGTFKPEQVVVEGELIIALTDVTQAADVIGKPAIVRSSSKHTKLVASLDVGIVRANESSLLTKEFCYFLMLSERYAQHSLGYTSGTTVLHLAKNASAKFEVSIPPAGLVNRFSKISSNLMKRIFVAEKESETLSELRDTLLPKLISGELRIPDAEKFLEEAGI